MIRRRRGRTPDVTGSRLPNGGWYLRIGMRLASPNKLRHSHWKVDHRERTLWAEAIGSALIVAANVRTWVAYTKLRDMVPVKERKRLLVTRQVPHRRHFIRDGDNLIYSTKRVRDALKGHGLIFDDSMKWLEFPEPVQEVSDDGKHWTILTIEPVQGGVQT